MELEGCLAAIQQDAFGGLLSGQAALIGWVCIFVYGYTYFYEMEVVRVSQGSPESPAQRHVFGKSDGRQ
jgi:hypothetical protein